MYTRFVHDISINGDDIWVSDPEFFVLSGFVSVKFLDFRMLSERDIVRIRFDFDFDVIRTIGKTADSVSRVDVPLIGHDKVIAEKAIIPSDHLRSGNIRNRIGVVISHELNFRDGFYSIAKAG